MTRSVAKTLPDGDRRINSRAELAYSKLRAAIHGGRFRPGQRLREAEIAGWLGISRTPVRDALDRLESDGLLKAAPRRGLIVSELDQQQVSDLYGVREVLEGLAARLAAQHVSDTEIVAMRDLLERQTRAASDDLAALARLNELFHEALYRTARNRYLVAVLDSLERSLALLPGTTYVAPGRAERALMEHSAILEAIERHDAQDAEALARRHLREAEQIRLLMISGATLDDLARSYVRSSASAARRGR